MDKKELLLDLDKVTKCHKEFDDKYFKHIRIMLKQEDLSPEDNLLLNDLIYISDKMSDIDNIISALQKPVSIEGVLTRDSDGCICLNGSPLDLFTELEIMKTEDEFNNKGWIRTIIYPRDSGYYLTGLDSDVDLTGIKARLR